MVFSYEVVKALVIAYVLPYIEFELIGIFIPSIVYSFLDLIVILDLLG